MKNLLFISGFFCLCSCGLAAPEGFVKIAVVDENGNRMKDCQITVSFEENGKYIRKSGVSQTNAFFEAQAPASIPKCTVIVKKEGYYESRQTKMFEGRDQAKNRYEPWGEVRILTLRKIIEPKDMVYKSVDLRSMPVEEEAVGFDLKQQDWVRPHGNGQINDLIFKADKNEKWIIGYTVSFSNEGDGIQEYEMPKDVSSVYRWPHKAPVDGYSSVLRKVTRGNPDVEAQKESPVKRNSDVNYIFRVRTELDEDGNVLSALYGRVSGELKVYSKGNVQFRYSLNPDPHSRSLESTHPTSP